MNNKVILLIAFTCCLISFINCVEVGKSTDSKPDENKPNESSTAASVESVEIKNENSDTVIKNENEKSEEEDYEDDDDDLSSKELSAIDQILDILTNVVVGEFTARKKFFEF